MILGHEVLAVIVLLGSAICRHQERGGARLWTSPRWTRKVMKQGRMRSRTMLVYRKFGVRQLGDSGYRRASCRQINYTRRKSGECLDPSQL